MSSLYPLVSIIIPTYNYAHFITEAINSILQQDYPQEKIEIIVVNDGSTDNTKEVLNAFIQNNTIKYIYQENKGKAAATYKAIQNAMGKYVFNLDADDYYLPGKIKQTVGVFESDETIVHVASPAQIFDQQKNTTKGAEGLPAKILEIATEGIALLKYFYGNNILYGGGSTYTARASVLKAIHIPAAVDMYIDEFLLLAALPFGKSYFIRQPLSVWRVHASNYSMDSLEEAHQTIKTERLLRSSVAMLAFLKQNDFDKTLVRIYSLKHSNRLIAAKEAAKTKTLGDIAGYTREMLFNIRPGWKLIRKYQVLNRLLPMPVYLFFKKSMANKTANAVSK